MNRVIPRQYIYWTAAFFVAVILGLLIWNVFQNRAAISDNRAEAKRAIAAEQRERDARLLVASIERRKSCEQDEATRVATLELLHEFGVPDQRIPLRLRTDRDCAVEAREYAESLRNPTGLAG